MELLIDQIQEEEQAKDGKPAGVGNREETAEEGLAEEVNNPSVYSSEDAAPTASLRETGQHQEVLLLEDQPVEERKQVEDRPVVGDPRSRLTKGKLGDSDDS